MKNQLSLLSIVIPTYNRKPMLERLLKSIVVSTYKNLEIIVVNDASSDNTADFLKKLKIKNLKVINNPKNLFAAGSRNAGLKISKGKYVFFIDDDNVLEKNTIEILVNEMDNNPNIGEIGPAIYSIKNKNRALWQRARRSMWTSKTYHDNKLKTKLNLLDTVDIPNAYMLRKSVLDKGKINFRKFYGIMYEESDVAYRIKKQGYEIFVAQKAKIYHDLEDRNFILDPRRPFVFARNRIIFHKLFSKNIFQFLSVAFIWSWFFAAYYINSIFRSKESAEISWNTKATLAFNYIKGNLTGIFLTLKGVSFE